METNVVPPISIYAVLLDQAQVDEVSLWRDVELYSLDYLFPGHYLDKDNFLPLVQSSERYYALKLTALEFTCRKYGVCVYMDSGSTLIRNASIFMDISRKLEQDSYFYGSFYREETAVVSTENAMAIEGSEILAFIDNSLPFNQFVKDKLACYRGIRCKSTDTAVSELGEDLLSDPTSLGSVDDQADLDDAYFCFISLRDDIIYNFAYSEHPAPPPLEKIRIGLGVPTTSAKLSAFNESSIVTAFLPSLLQSIEEDEWRTFEFYVYIAFDRYDHFWDVNETFYELNETMTMMASAHYPAHTLRFIYVRMPPSKGWLTFIWNHLFARSMFDGCHYYYQLNDDLNFVSSRWASELTSALWQNQDYGVAGPNDLRWNCEVLTQAMVSRKHWSIFGWFYPPEVPHLRFIVFKILTRSRTGTLISGLPKSTARKVRIVLNKLRL